MRASLTRGTILGGFCVQSLIAEGATGSVYLAEDVRTADRVALKVLSPELADEERFRQRFLRESQVAASLHHPHITPTISSGDVDGRLFIAMAYIDGPDLRELLRREGSLEPERALALTSQVAEALDAAHAAGLVHRDVKPGNILVASVNGEEHAYLCDFGLARHASSVSSLTGERGFVGTIDYVPPEQIEGGTIDLRADVYSLGCVLFECLAGMRPYARESELSVVFAHLNEPPPQLSVVKPQLPTTFDAVFATALAKAPADRYASCGELATAARAAGRGEVPRTARHRRSFATAAAALVAVVAAAVAATVHFSGGRAHARGSPKPPLALRADAVNLVDARTHRLVADVPLGKGAVGDNGADVVFTPGAGWVLLVDAQRLVRVDLATRRVTNRVKLPWTPGARMASGGGAVWVTNAEGPDVWRIDASTARVTKRFEVPGGNGKGIAFGDGSLWLAQGLDIARIDPRTGSVIHRISDGPGQPSQESWLVFADGDLWSAQAAQGIVDKIDPVTNERVVRGTLDGWVSDLAVGGGYVWASKVPDGVVYKLSPDNLGVLASLPAGADPERVTLTGTEVWVANTAPSGLSALAGDNGARQGVTTANQPATVSYHNGLVWTAAMRTPPALPPINGFEVNLSTPTWEFSADPTHQHSTLEYQLDEATCSSLLRYPDASSRLVPEVAVAMPTISNAGRTYTFTIGSGYRFSPPSSQAVTAETFARTIERSLWPKLNPSFAAYWMSDVVGIDAFESGKAAHVSGIAAHGDKLSITLEQPAGDFLARLALPYFCPVPSTQARVPVSTPSGPVPSAGPYYVASTSGNRTVLLRNPNYHGPRRRRAARIVYTVGVPSTQAIAGAQSGAMAMLPALDDNFSPLKPTNLLDQLYGPHSAAARAGGQRFYETASLFMDGIVLNTGRPLFRSLRLRQAINEALDRPTLARLYYDAPADQMIPPAVPGYPVGRFYPVDGPNLKRARQLAGTSHRAAVLYYCTGGAFGDPRQRAVAQLVRTDLARIGIAVSIITADCDPTFSYDATAKRADLLLAEWGTNVADPEQYLKQALQTGSYGAALGPGLWSSRSFRRQVAAAHGLRGAARARRFQQLEAELMRAAPYAVYGDFLSGDYFSPRFGCRRFEGPGRYVDLGALCVR
jgi:ABC-type transport system substrate-binding protein/tRNA A-37 threonylcarbamoyl transferase component Bud32